MSTIFKKPKLPEGPFGLVNPALPKDADPRDLVPELEVDGPFDGSRVAYDNDGATVLLTEGAPYRMGVVKQRGSLLTFQGDHQARIVPWPASS
jgi:hypothetical protein